ncbi:MAG: ankyrin repeat domain-containing protein [Flavobacterium sp. JAD_PAG50586_2]|nr:MAG: ankyrin repeat domain-containing protein [Flavobacterium sp. JAD_PAG50586_2]
MDNSIQSLELSSAIEKHENEKAKRLIDDVGTDLVGYGGTALNFAAFYNNLEIAKYAIEKGADVNHSFASSKGKGFTPLMAACEKGNVEMVKLLIHNGADVNASDSHGRTALDILVFEIRDNEEEILKVLLNAGVDPKRFQIFLKNRLMIF